MNAKGLLQYYYRIADTSGAVDRLRQLIFALAVRGKLAPQSAKDDSVLELKARLIAEKSRIGRTAKLEPRRDPEISDALVPIPKSWSWIPLFDLGRLSGGMTPSMNRHEYWGGNIVWLSPKDIKADEVSNSELKITEAGLAETRLEAYPPGSLFIVARSGILKRTLPVAINRVSAAANQDLKVLVPYVRGMERYLQIMFRGLEPLILQRLVKTGTTVQSLKYAEFESQPFPIPPLAEQQRIVAKVDELMALCDQLEKARAERETRCDKLTAATLARLNTPNAETFPNDARFALDNLQALTRRPDQIKQLRETILKLAVQGKLVPQLASEKPFEIEDSATSSAVPFSVPDSWRWVRLSSLGTLKGGGTPSKGRDDFWNGPIPWVSPKDMKVDYIEQSELGITDAAVAGSAVNLIDVGSLLFVVRGMILAHSFPVAITRVVLTINQDMKALTLRHPEMSEYLLRALKGLKTEMLNQVKRSSHGTCRLEGEAYRNLMLPIPPAEEQHRIVAKVDMLMAICDELECTLGAGDTTRRSLLDVLLLESLGPSSEQQDGQEFASRLAPLRRRA